MDGDDFTAPFEPQAVPDAKAGVIRHYCLSPTNGRLEWIKAEVKKDGLNKGADITDEMAGFLMAGDKNPMDKPALIVHKSLGGTGDEPWNLFLEGRSFDRDTYNNDVESTVFYALQNATDAAKPATITVKFLFKNQMVTRPYKLSYQVELPNGDVIENDLSNA